MGINLYYLRHGHKDIFHAEALSVTTAKQNQINMCYKSMKIEIFTFNELRILRFANQLIFR